MEDGALHVMLNSKLRSNFKILNMSFEVDRGHIKCCNRETANKVCEILLDCNRVSAIKMKAWFPWESATSLVTVVRRDTVLTDLPYIIKMWQILNRLPEKGWHRPQLKIADRVAINTFGADGSAEAEAEDGGVYIRPHQNSQEDWSTGSSKKEPAPPQHEVPSQEEEEIMDAENEAEAELQPDTNREFNSDIDNDVVMESGQPCVDDLGTDMDQQCNEPFNWAVETEKEVHLCEQEAAKQHHT